MKAYNVSWSYKENDEYPSIQPVIAKGEADALTRVANAMKDGDLDRIIYIYDVQLVGE